MLVVFKSYKSLQSSSLEVLKSSSLEGPIRDLLLDRSNSPCNIKFLITFCYDKVIGTMDEFVSSLRVCEFESI